MDDKQFKALQKQLRSIESLLKDQNNLLRKALGQQPVQHPSQLPEETRQELEDQGILAARAAIGEMGVGSYQ